MVARETIDAVLQRTNIADVIEHRIPTVRRGGRITALCPFHSEKTPSLHVNVEKGFFKCFGCGAYGDAIAFVQRYGRLTFSEALSQLASACGVPVTARHERQAAQRKRSDPEQDLAAAIEAARQQRLRRDENDTPLLRSRDVVAGVARYNRDTGAALVVSHDDFVWERCAPHDRDPLWPLCLYQAAWDLLEGAASFKWVCLHLSTLFSSDRRFMVAAEDRAAELLHEIGTLR